jgi:Tfp pilus assembly protein PilF
MSREEPGRRSLRNLAGPLPLAVVLGLVGTAGYLAALSPSVGWYDSPELTGVARTFGIAHPTGYPLYALAGRLVTLLAGPLGESVRGADVLSALSGGLTLALLALLAWHLTGLIGLGPVPRAVRLAACALPVTVLGPLPLFMMQASSAEVYALHTLLAALLLLIGAAGVLAADRRRTYPYPLPGDRPDGGGGPRYRRYPLLLAFLAGLGAGNHATLVLYLPALLYLLVWAYRLEGGAGGRRDGRPLRQWVGATVLFGLLGLSVYLIVPLRAQLNPPFNWGAADNLSDFLRLVTAAEARARETQFFPVTIVTLWVRMAAGMSWPVVLLCAAGWVWAGIRRPALGGFALLYFLFPLAFLLLGLDILEDAFLPVHLFLSAGAALLVVLAGETLVGLFGADRGGSVGLAAAVLVLLLGPGLHLGRTGREVAPDGRWGPSGYLMAVDASAAGSAIPDEQVVGWVFAEDNTTAFLLWYQQRIEHRYPGVEGIYLLLARERWYREQLRRRLPELAVPDLERRVERLPHALSAYALIESNRPAGVPLLYSPILLPDEEFLGTLVPQGVLLRIEPSGYRSGADDRRRHAEIMREWAPAMQGEVPDLDVQSRDWWSDRHRILGQAWARLAQWEAAEAEYRAGVLINPARAETWVALAGFLAAEGKWEEAESAYRQALQLVPGDGYLRFEIARTLIRRGRFAEAGEVLPAEAAAGVPGWEYLQLRASIRHGLGQLDEGEADLREAARLAPASGSVQNDLGIMLLSRGELSGAREAFETAVSLDPQLPEAWLNLANFDLRAGNWSRAQERLERALAAGADTPAARYELGTALYYQRNYARAESVLRENLRQWPRHADSYLLLGLVQEARGEFPAALATYELGRMSVPEDPRFAERLAVIRALPPARAPAPPPMPVVRSSHRFLP